MSISFITDPLKSQTAFLLDHVAYTHARTSIYLEFKLLLLTIAVECAVRF